MLRPTFLRVLRAGDGLHAGVHDRFLEVHVSSELHRQFVRSNIPTLIFYSYTGLTNQNISGYSKRKDDH